MGRVARAFTLSLNGLYFTANAVVRLDGVALPTTPVAATQLTATGATSAAQKGKDVPALIGQAGVGGVTSGTVTVRVMAETPTPTPGPGLDTADLKAGRWLEQAAFGPTRRRWRGSS